MTAPTLQAPRVKARLRHHVSRAVAEIELPSSWSVQEATRELVRAIDLPRVDHQNRETVWDLFVRRADGTAERLRPSSTVGESVREDDELEPLPEVMPG
jgi:hypothetical protein